MGFLSKTLQNRSVYGADYTTLADLSFLKMLGINTDSNNVNNNINSAYKLSEITYFTCLKVLSDKVGSCKIDIYQKTPQGKQKIQHYLDYILNVQPNPLQNASIFWSTTEYNKNEYGNAYVFIDTNLQTGKVDNLWILPSQNVQVWIDDAGIFGSGTNAIWYLYTDLQSGKVTKIPSTSILHFKNWVTYQGQGLKGLSVKNILNSYITQAQYNSNFVNGLVQNGFASDKIVLQYTGSLDIKGKNKLMSELNDFSANGKWIPLPIGMEAKPISSSLVDAQYMDLTKYNALQIASAFGISPSFINNYDKGNYANVESQQDSLYRDCLYPLFNQYGQEETIKLLTTQEKQQNIYMEYNMDSMLQGDFNSRMTGYSTAVNAGIMSRNEARLQEGLIEKDGADNLTVNGTMINITDVGKQYGVPTKNQIVPQQDAKGGDSNG
ncbi:phage portal protein [Clostridium felsineum]|uniref:Uncharacterized protein n=1 Tax=Clostridium felsineum TaxID=36839 RepID=A0A1S8M2I5_9CLOT|nr:phage portal protein [Clostridium felsineum]URZ06775.1 hypothetical protein CLROS_021080 [Clostridium felsineum]URZ11807.1 hypothetical protein CROST_025240 [Clostridium felsineum]